MLINTCQQTRQDKKVMFHLRKLILYVYVYATSCWHSLSWCVSRVQKQQLHQERKTARKSLKFLKEIWGKYNLTLLKQWKNMLTVNQSFVSVNAIHRDFAIHSKSKMCEYIFYMYVFKPIQSPISVDDPEHWHSQPSSVNNTNQNVATYMYIHVYSPSMWMTPIRTLPFKFMIELKPSNVPPSLDALSACEHN